MSTTVSADVVMAVSVDGKPDMSGEKVRAEHPIINKGTKKIKVFLIICFVFFIIKLSNATMKRSMSLVCTSSFSKGDNYLAMVSISYFL